MFSKEEIFKTTPDHFDQLALQVFAHQYENIEAYKQFSDMMGKTPKSVQKLIQIPFLPIQFFKSHTMLPRNQTVQMIFESSGTTNGSPSKNYVTDISWYEESFLRGFEFFYGSPVEFVFLGLLPSYLERQNSSLIYMVNHLMKLSGKNANGFYLDDFSGLFDMLDVLKTGKRKTVLFGVTYALLDFVKDHKIDFPDLVVIETGGMKGKRDELSRQAVHQILRTGFGVNQVHSEYGMTELFSQAYSRANGVFQTPPWMKILLRDTSEPTKVFSSGRQGAINVIDLANVNSCSFIATDDIGSLREDGQFEVLGRAHTAEQRGCNLMVE